MRYTDAILLRDVRRAVEKVLVEIDRDSLNDVDVKVI